MFVREPTRPSFIDKAGCTQQFESNFHCAHLHSFFPLRKAPPLITVFFNSLYAPLRFPCFRGTETLRGKEETALLGARNRYAIRLADHQRSRQRGCAGWDRMGFLSHRTINKLYYILFNIFYLCTLNLESQS